MTTSNVATMLLPRKSPRPRKSPADGVVELWQRKSVDMMNSFKRESQVNVKADSGEVWGCCCALCMVGRHLLTCSQAKLGVKEFVVGLPNGCSSD
eukprot:m.128186 g.128186  ORF g.128186 m.128186 type:complete len:95 (+) comp37945_c0_seq10:1175-1459(+)